MFTKAQIKEAWANHQQVAKQDGRAADEARLGLANEIANNAHFGDKVRSGEDYISHPQHIASKFESKTKKIIAILHDAIEDSQKRENPEERWTLDDLRELGFSERIIRAVDGVTKRPGEPYFDFIVRCGQSGEDAIGVKIQDLKHNSDNTRSRNIKESNKQVRKRQAYNIAFNYLIDIKKQHDEGGHYNAPGTSIVDYIKSRKEYASEPITINSLLAQFSSEEERLPAPRLVEAAARSFGWRRVQVARDIGYSVQELAYG